MANPTPNSEPNPSHQPTHSTTPDPAQDHAQDHAPQASRNPAQSPASTPSDIRWTYITVSNREEARNIGQTLVEEKIAACVNLLAPMESIYLWNGEMQQDQETVLIAKTTAQMMPTLTRRVKELHSYEVPCILAIPVAHNEGNHEFLAWIRQQVEVG